MYSLWLRRWVNQCCSSGLDSLQIELNSIHSKSEVVPWLEQECERKKQENGMTEQMKNESLQSEDVFIAPAVYMNFDEISLPLFWMENNGWKKVKNATQQKSKPKEKMKPTAPAKIQGYCENCRVAFTDMIKVSLLFSFLFANNRIDLM